MWLKFRMSPTERISLHFSFVENCSDRVQRAEQSIFSLQLILQMPGNSCKVNIPKWNWPNLLWISLHFSYVENCSDRVQRAEQSIFSLQLILQMPGNSCKVNIPKWNWPNLFILKNMNNSYFSVIETNCPTVFRLQSAVSSAFKDKKISLNVGITCRQMRYSIFEYQFFFIQYDTRNF